MLPSCMSIYVTQAVGEVYSPIYDIYCHEHVFMTNHCVALPVVFIFCDLVCKTENK
jgi:hypothetical protein